MWFQWRRAMKLLRSYPGAAIQVAGVMFVVTLGIVATCAVAVGVWRDLDRQTTDVRFDVVLTDDVSDSAAINVANSMSTMKSVQSAGIYSPEAMWKQLSRTTGVKVNNMESMLDMPTIIRCRLVPSAATIRKCIELDAQLQQAHGPVIRDVVWSKFLVSEIENRRNDVIYGSVAVGILWFAVLIFGLVFSLKALLIRAKPSLHIGHSYGASVMHLAVAPTVATKLCGSIGFALACICIALVWPHAVSYRYWLGWFHADEIALVCTSVFVLSMIEVWLQALVAVARSIRKAGADRAS